MRHASFALRLFEIAIAISLVSTPAVGLEILVTAAEEEETPIAGASISIWTVTPSGNKRLVDRVRTGDDGLAALGRLLPGSIVAVTAAGRVRRDLLADEITPPRVAVPLERGLSQTIRVQDHEGKPLARYRVAVVPAEAIESRLITITLLPPALVPGTRFDAAVTRDSLAFAVEGRFVIDVEADDGEMTAGGLSDAWHLALVGVPLGGVWSARFRPDPSRPLEITVDRRECRQVVASGDSSRVEGAITAPSAVFLEEPMQRIWPAWPSAADGIVALGCPAQVFGVPSHRAIAAPGFAPTPVVVDRSGVVRLHRGGTVTGTAFDADHQPLVDHRVLARVWGVERTDRIDATGSFRLEGLPTGRVDVALFAPSGEWKTGTRLELEPDETRRITLGAPHFVPVQVALGDQPVADAPIALLATEGGDPVIAGIGETDGEGRARISVVVEPDRIVAVLLRWDEMIGTLPVHLERPSNDDGGDTGSDEARIRATVDGRWLEGLVVDAEDDTPLERRRISVGDGKYCLDTPLEPWDPFWLRSLDGIVGLCTPDRWYAVTASDRKGEFRVFAESGSRPLRAQDPRRLRDGPRYEETAVDLGEVLEDDAPFVTVRMRRAGSVVVRVSDEANEVPSGCAVGYGSAARNPMMYDVLTSCTREGNVFFPAAETALLFFARAPGYAPAIDGPVTLAPDRATDVALVLTRGGTLRVRVPGLPRYDSRPYVPPGFLTDAAGRDWGIIAEPEISPEGDEVTIRDLPSGLWVVRFGDEVKKVRVEVGTQTVVAFDD